MLRYRALNQFEAALYGPTFANPASGWRAYGNETTFIDWFLTAELLKNTKHSYHGAVYMYKVGDGADRSPHHPHRDARRTCAQTHT